MRRDIYEGSDVFSPFIPTPLPPIEGVRGELFHIGDVRGEDGWQPFLVDLRDLKFIILAGPKKARVSIGASLLFKEFLASIGFTVLDTGRGYRTLFKALPRAKLYRLGLDSTLNPFSIPETWREFEAYSYASLVSKSYAICFNLTRIHASLMCRALCKLYAEKPNPTLLEVIQAVEGEVEPLARLQGFAEELKSLLASMQEGYVGACLLGVEEVPSPSELEEACIVELSYLPTSELRAFIQACFMAKLSITARLKGLMSQYTLLIEDAQHLFQETRGWKLEELISNMLDAGLNLHLSTPSAAALPSTLRGEGIIILEALEGGLAHLVKVSTSRGKMEAKLSTYSWLEDDLTDCDVDLLVESRTGVKPRRVGAPRRRSLTTLEELFLKEEVRAEAYNILSYLRDNYSTFKGLFELMNLPKELARKTLIKLYRNKLIAQSEVGGVKVVTLTDLGRLVLEEYESSLEGEGIDGGKVA